jgi:hypothetical protein
MGSIREAHHQPIHAVVHLHTKQQANTGRRHDGSRGRGDITTLAAHGDGTLHAEGGSIARCTLGDDNVLAKGISAGVIGVDLRAGARATDVVVDEEPNEVLSLTDGAVHHSAVGAWSDSGGDGAGVGDFFGAKVAGGSFDPGTVNSAFPLNPIGMETPVRADPAPHG